MHTVRSDSYTSFNMPHVIAYGNFITNTTHSQDRSLQFVYGPEHQRIKQSVSLTGNGTSKYFAGNVWYLNGEDSLGLSYEKEIRTNGTTEHKHYIKAAGLTFAEFVSRTGTLNGLPATTTNYFHHDQLGSISAITDQSGVVAERLAYDPWGKRRFVNTTVSGPGTGSIAISGLPDKLDAIVGIKTDRGYTEHEHLDEVGIIHMNGRIYDPLIGRFMSADPYIQAPTNLKTFNRYAYVWNNPLKYYDPDGFRAHDYFRVKEDATQVIDNPSAGGSSPIGAAFGYRGGLTMNGGGDWVTIWTDGSTPGGGGSNNSSNSADSGNGGNGTSAGNTTTQATSSTNDGIQIAAGQGFTLAMPASTTATGTGAIGYVNPNTVPGRAVYDPRSDNVITTLNPVQISSPAMGGNFITRTIDLVVSSLSDLWDKLNVALSVDGAKDVKPAEVPKTPEGGRDTPANILAPGGVPIGENIDGAKPGVQTVSPSRLTDIIDRLKGTDAVLDPNRRYPGDWYNLPGGQGGFGVRDSRDNGRTVDVNIPGVPDVTKIHER